VRFSFSVVSFAVLGLVACSLTSDPGSERLESADELDLCSAGLLGQALKSGGVPPGCTKIEGSQIGRAPQTLALAQPASVTITSWTAKAGSTSEYVGFSFTSVGPISYAVKTGTQTYAGTATTWQHPEGTSGSDAPAISNITFCPTDGGVPEAPVDAGTADAGSVNPCGGGIDAGCVTTADCLQGLTCINGTCQIQIL
jgi:hypothetical protein